MNADDLFVTNTTVHLTVRAKDARNHVHKSYLRVHLIARDASYSTL
jgi:hypothetical protein